MGHLICDLWAGSKVPWLAPFEQQVESRKKKGARFWVVYLIPELVGLPLTLRLLRRDK